MDRSEQQIRSRRVLLFYCLRIFLRDLALGVVLGIAVIAISFFYKGAYGDELRIFGIAAIIAVGIFGVIRAGWVHISNMCGLTDS